MKITSQLDLSKLVQTARQYKVRNSHRARVYYNPDGAKSWSLKPADERVRALRTGIIAYVDQSHTRATRNTIIIAHANIDGTFEFSRYRCFIQNTALLNIGQQVQTDAEIAYLTSYSPVFLDVFTASDLNNKTTWNFIGPGIIQLENLV